jgi:nitroreductase
MQTWDAIRARRNVRQYTDQPIAREDLERICEAGRRAPSAGNGQPWNFVVVTDRAQLIELAKVWERGGKQHRPVGGGDRPGGQGTGGRAAARPPDV